ncbi:oligosaccharide flippase family protein [Olleya sp. ITB9]|uniref:oligosaccharide flippase family protein n=1 Tax=Olleya sp. ITB9 TaxID=1715648 RepID=UPI0006D0DC1B|nr:oligosaccharide flippase family protein [Olleya sp. ITB9]
MSIKNNLYNIFGGAGRAILFLLTIPLMVNYMGVEKFGVWALITSIGNIALMLDVGIASTTMHFVSEINALETKEEVEHKTKTVIPILLIINVLLSAIVAISFLFFTTEIAHVFLNNSIVSDDIIIALRWIGLYSSIMLIQHLFSGIMQAYNQFLTVNIIKFINIFVINIGLLVFSFLEEDFVTLTFYMFSISILTLLTYIYLASKKLNIFKIKPKFDYQTTKNIISYSGTTWVGYFGSVIFTQFDKIIIGKITTPEILGIYAAIISITSYISSIATVGLQPIIPRLTELWTKVKTKKEEFVNEYKHAIQFNTFLIFFASLLMLIIYKVLLENIMNINLDIYPDSILAFKLAIFIYAFNSLSIPGFYTLMAIKKTKYIGIWQLTGSFLALFSIYLFGQSYGLYGVIIGNIGLIITLMFNIITAKIIVKKPFEWFKYIFKPILIFSITISLILMVNNVYLNSLFALIAIVLLVIWYFNQQPELLIIISNVIKKRKNEVL